MSSTFLEVFCDLLKGLPNDFARELANVQRLDRQVEDLKPKMESAMAAALNICHSNRKIEGPELTKLLQHLKTERDGESEALRLTLEKIAIFDHTIAAINSYMDRLEEDIERYEEAVDDSVRHQAAVEEAKMDGTYQPMSSGYGYRPSQSGGYGSSAGGGGSYQSSNLARATSAGGGGGGGYGYQGGYSGGAGGGAGGGGAGAGGYSGAGGYAAGAAGAGSGAGTGYSSGSQVARRTSGVGAGTSSGGRGVKGVDHMEVVQASEAQPVYCICGSSDTDDSMMIGCDNKKCVREWFHLECVGLKKAPQGAWYCDDCTRKGFKA